MTVADLIAALEREDPDAEVRLMSQPAWPFEYDIRGLWAPAAVLEPCQAEVAGGPHVALAPCGEPVEVLVDGTVAHVDPAIDDHPPLVERSEGSFEPARSAHRSLPPVAADVAVLYLVEGEQLGYGTKAAFEEAR